jgi:hypothetical protein
VHAAVRAVRQRGAVPLHPQVNPPDTRDRSSPRPARARVACASPRARHTQSRQRPSHRIHK